MKYLAFYRWFEGCATKYGTDLEELKKPWCWQIHIFEAGEYNEDNKLVIPKDISDDDIVKFLDANLNRVEI